MKSLKVVAGVVLLAIASNSPATAQYWGYRDDGPRYRDYGSSWRSACGPAIERHNRYYYRAQRYDGFIDQGEWQVLRRLQADVDRCRAAYEYRRWR